MKSQKSKPCGAKQKSWLEQERRRSLMARCSLPADHALRVLPGMPVVHLDRGLGYQWEEKSNE